jgi:RNA polymerase primary sigma factor
MTLPEEIKELLKRDLPNKPLGELLQDLKRDLPEAFDTFLSTDDSSRRDWIDSKIGASIEIDEPLEITLSTNEIESGGELPELHWLTPILRFKPASSEEHELWAKQIEAGVFAREKLESSKDRLDSKMASDLNKIVEIGENSNKLFILHNLRLVWSIARKSPKILSTEEHFQNGVFGLIRGIQKFDWRQGFQFSTYASWWIRQSIWRSMADTSHTIRLPVHILEKVNSELRILADSEEKDSEDASEDAEEISAPVAKNPLTDSLVLAKNAIYRNYSYEMIVEKYDFLLEYEVDPFEDTTFDYSVQSTFARNLNAVLGGLTVREEMVMKKRYGLSDGDPKTLEEIGLIFGVTRERIRQIESKTMSKLRHPSRTNHLKDYLEANLSNE